MRSSKAAFDLIVSEEVTSEAVYKKKYRRPEWPGVQSGATVGIGYDLGQTAKSTVIDDWKGRVPDGMLASMVSACGQTGAAGKKATARIRDAVDIPWGVALAVHEEKVVPRWEGKLAKALPNTDKLSPDSFGALLSLIFNRGTSFNLSGDRYSEMRAIKRHMAAMDFAAIPAELRAMKRIWPKVAGLRKRRDTEAALFEKGLKGSKAEDHPQIDPLPLAEAAIQGDAKVWNVQRRLSAMNYNPGTVDGLWGGRTGGAITGFINDRGLKIAAPTNAAMFDKIHDVLADEIAKAEGEGFTRPISIERSEATEATVSEKAPEIVPVKRSRLAALWATITSIVLGVVNALADYFQDAMSWVVGLKQYAADAPAYLWFIIAAGVALVIWFAAKNGANGIVEAFRKGDRA